VRAAHWLSHVDAAYFARSAMRELSDSEVEAIHRTTLAAYRWQYITSGVQDERFLGILGPMITADQGARINAALAPVVGGSIN
jgi:hypothetical protein